LKDTGFLVSLTSVIFLTNRMNDQLSTSLTCVRLPVEVILVSTPEVSSCFMEGIEQLDWLVQLLAIS
jgi:hypothetical protein